MKNIKKIVLFLLISTLVAGLVAGCADSEKGEKNPEEKKSIVVGASITPHAEILREAAKIMAEKGYTLTVREFDDYVIPNKAVESGELDANYFQHLPYLQNFNEENRTHLVSVAAIHYEPFGIYAGRTKKLSDIKDGASIAIPNDGTNEARALKLLEAQGLIQLKEDADFTATKLDIAENPKNLDIQEVNAAQLARSLEDVDFAVINGNYALQAGLNAGSDALATEAKDSESASTYANIVAVKEGNENLPIIKALVESLQSQQIKQFIDKTYSGAVVAIF